ncbi:MAG TPA: Ig-like domain-containing protein, partial [Planctomycetota bacterium]
MRKPLIPLIGCLLFCLHVAQLPAATLTVEPISWDVVGLDSNNVNAGPNLYLVGVRVTNTGGGTATNVVGTFNWEDALTVFDDGNVNTAPYIVLQQNSLTTLSVPSLIVGKSTDFYYNVWIKRNTAAYDQVRRYHVTVTQTGGAPVVSPTPRQIYVEHLISQNRNGVDSMAGPTDVFVGGTYQYTVVYHTATQGYDQLMAFAGFQNNPFQIVSVKTTYSAPPGVTNDIVYADAGGWDNDPTSPTYRQIIGPIPAKYAPGGKAGGGPITSIYTIKINSLAPGGNGAALTVCNTINDHSGSSYHYNSDFGAGGTSITVKVWSGDADLSIAKTQTFGTQTMTSGTAAFRLSLTNSASSTVAASNIQVSDVLPAGLTYVSSVPATGAYNSVSGLWSVPSLAIGASTTLDVNATVSRTAGTTITNTATITALDQNDPNPANNSASYSLGDQVTLNLSKTPASQNANQGATVNFTLTLTNASSPATPATGVKVTDVVNNANFQFVSASTTFGSYDSASGIWNVGSVVNGTPATLTITARVANTGTLTNTANITAVDQANNGTASASANVIASYPAANLVQLATSETFTTGSNVAIGEIVHYRLEYVLPKGPTAAAQFVHTLPTGMSYLGNPKLAFVSNIPGGASYTCRLRQAANLASWVQNATYPNGAFAPGTNKVNGDNSANPQLNDLILVSAQTDARQNGIYRALGNGAGADWERLSTYTPVNGDVVSVTAGTPGGTPVTSAGSFVLQAKVHPNGANTPASLNVTDLVYTASGGPVSSSTFGTAASVTGDETTLATITPSYVMASGVPAANATGAITFSFGDLTNPDPDANKEFVVLEFNALVQNINSSRFNTPTYFDNSFVVHPPVAPGGTTSNTLRATLVEPSISGAKTANVTKLTRNSTVNYTLTYTMSAVANTTNAYDIVISDPLPSVAPNSLALNLGSVAWTNSAGVTGIINTSAGNTVGLTISSMTPGDFIQITYSATVSGTATIGANIANAALLTYTSLPGGGTTSNPTGQQTPAAGERDGTTAPTPPNNYIVSNSASLPVSVTADVQVTACVNTSGTYNVLSNPNDVVTILLTAKNNGPDSASNVLVTNLLPSGLTYLSGQTLSPSKGSIGGSGSTTTWNVGALNNGESATLSIQATLGFVTNVQVNKATVTATEFDPVANNNNGYCSVTPVEAELAITDMVSPASPNTIGQNVTYTINLVNNGPNSASNVTVSVQVPAWLNGLVFTPNFGSYAGGVWTIPAIPVSTTSSPNIQTLTIAGTLNAIPAPTFTHTVTITHSDQYDSISSNNTASVTIPLLPPVAVNDSYSAIRNTALVVSSPGVLTNDTLYGATISGYGVNGNEQSTIGLSTLTSQGGSVQLYGNGSFRYVPLNNFTGSDTFKYTLTNTAGSRVATVTLTVAASLTPPTAASDSYSTNEDTPLTVPAQGVLANDTLNGANLTGFGASGGNEQTTLGSATPTAHGSVTLNADGSFTYTPASNFNGTDSFRYTITNGAGSSAATATITVNSVNDPPAGTDKTITINEDAVYTFASSDFGFTDPNDSPANNFNRVEITTLPAAGTLKLSGATFLAGTFITVANIPNLTFTPVANANGSPYTTFTFQVEDDGGGANLDLSANTITVNVTPVNDPPAGTDKTITINEDAVYTFTASDFGFTDPNDSPANNFNRVEITTLPAAGTLKLSGATFVAGTFITVANIPNLTFTPAANANGSPYTTFTFQVEDDGGGTNLDLSPNTITFNVTSVNDPPAGTDKTITINEDAVYTFAASDFGFTDPLDSPANNFSRVEITTLPAAGTLKLSGAMFLAGTFITVANIPNLTFTPAANANGSPYTTFTFQVEDDGGGADLDLSPNTITVNVTPVNDPPAGTDKTITINEDATYTFAASDFGFTDPLDSPANNFSRVEITTLPAAGTLKLSGATFVAGTFITVANIPNLTFTPVANANGSPYTTFTFQVEDDGGGANLDLSANTITVTLRRSTTRRRARTRRSRLTKTL